MFVVPVSGDVITTHEGDTYPVASYTNYKVHGPAVYVDSPGVHSTVYFSDIAKINGVPVKLSGKLFVATGRIKRRYHLPQPGDVITVRVNDEPVDLKVTGYRLHSKSSGLSSGLIIQTKNSLGETVGYRLDHIIDVQLSIGNNLFDRSKFLSYYKDYRGYTK